MGAIAPARYGGGLRRHRLLTRGAPLAVIAGVAFAGGVVIALAPGKSERRLVTRYVTAWSHGDFARMYGMLDASSRRKISASRFASDYRSAASIATLTAILPGR